MASISALRDEIHPGCCCAGEWMLFGSYPAPTGCPRLASGVYAPADDQNRLAIAATESRPTIHHGQHQSPTR